MKTNALDKKTEKSLLERLAERVQELYVAAQKTAPLDRGGIYALYRKAYLNYREHKTLAVEQDARLLMVALG